MVLAALIATCLNHVERLIPDASAAAWKDSLSSLVATLPRQFTTLPAINGHRAFRRAKPLSPKFHDFTILDAASSKVGEIRVKPSGVLWAPKGAHEWYGVDLDTFKNFMETQGKRQKK